MPKFFVTQFQVNNNTIKIQGGDVNHIKNVLRMKEKDKLQICIMPINEKEEQGTDTTCEISEINDEYVLCNILKYEQSNVESKIHVTIFQGLPKSNKMELIIQKSVELGAYDIYPVEMKRCVVKLKEQDERKKNIRWQKIAEVASKQSGRNIIPQIHNCIKITDICKLVDNYDKIIVAYEEEKNQSLKSELKSLKEKNKIAIVIGPEAGIDHTEIEMLKKAGASIVTLGNRILRTETVALNVLSNVMYEFDQ